MINKFFQAIKSFLYNLSQYVWLEHLLLYLFIAGLIAVLIIMILWWIRTKKEIKLLNKDKRKRDKETLKFLSNRKNKTY